jgi:hypothetical protein
LSSSFINPFRCWIAEAPDTVSVMIRFGSTLKPAASISRIWLSAVWSAVALPAETRDATIAGVAAHLRFVESQDWPDMLAGKATLQQVSPGLDGGRRQSCVVDDQ